MTGPKCGATARCKCKAIRGKRGMCSRHYEIWLSANRAVPREIVLAHLDRLRAAGFGQRHIAELAGVGFTTVGTIRRGESTKCYAPVARAILAVNPDQNRPARLNPVGTIRRVQALVAHGYTGEQISAAIGVRQANLWKYQHGSASWVFRDTHDRIDAAFRTLSVQPQPAGTSANRARAVAARRGYLPALAWDLETIDDPSAQPLVEAIRQPPKLGTVLEDFRIEYLELRDEIRLSDAAIADRLGISDDLPLKRLSRLGIPTQQGRVAS